MLMAEFKSDSRERGRHASQFEKGERVRVIRAGSAYTGCRGSILEASGPAQGAQLPLGYYVAIDGENGLSRPFLASDLARLRAVKVQPLENVERQAGS
jgi:hypothetical protein